MDFVYIKKSDLELPLQRLFGNDDLISLEDIISKFEDLAVDYEVLQEKYEDLKNVDKEQDYEEF